MATRLSVIVDAIHTSLADATVLKQIGRLKNKENTQLRRVVWVHARSPVKPSSRTGGMLVTGTPNKRVRQCYTLHERIEVHIYAENEDNTEQLMHNVLAAIHVTCGPNAEPTEYEWITENPDVADYALRQPKIVLLVTFHIPVLEEQKPLTTITGHEHTGKFGPQGEVVC